MKCLRNLAAFIAFTIDEFLYEARKVQQHHRR